MKGAWGAVRIILSLFFLFIAVWCFRKADSVRAESGNKPALKPSGIDEVTERDFEAICTRLLYRSGYSEIMTVSLLCPAGTYIVAWKNGERWTFRCRMLDDVVSTELVWETVKAADRYRCSRCGVIAAGGFSWRARRFAETSCVELIDRDELLGMISQAGIKI